MRTVIPAIAAIAALALTATASAAEKAIWGPATLAPGESAFPMYEDLGVDVFQMQLAWNSVAPTRPANPLDPADPAYRWPATLDNTIAEARKHGIKVALMITGAPPWANGGRPSVWAPSNPGDFAQFAAAASRRYPPVRRWMIWGEPNLGARFKPNVVNDGIAARTYAPILDGAYGALKSVSSANIVIGGMTWSGGEQRPPDFIRDMKLADGTPPRLDWFGHNPFPFRYPNLRTDPQSDFRDMSDLDTLSAEIDAAYRGTRSLPVRLWLSEFTILSDHGSDAFATFVTRGQQAVWLKAAFRIADRLGARVSGLGWFGLIDQPPAPTASNWGLLTSKLARKPAYDAFYDAPSRRHAAVVSVPKTVRLAWIKRRGLGVRVSVRSAGMHTLHLRRGNRIIRIARFNGSAKTVRLRSRLARRGTYTVRVLTPRGETQVRTVRVR